MATDSRCNHTPSQSREWPRERPAASSQGAPEANGAPGERLPPRYLADRHDHRDAGPPDHPASQALLYTEKGGFVVLDQSMLAEVAAGQSRRAHVSNWSLLLFRDETAKFTPQFFPCSLDAVGNVDGHHSAQVRGNLDSLLVQEEDPSTPSPE